jgi:hypothetical protein
MQPQIGIDHPHQRQVQGKLCPLATSCVPMMISAPPPANGFDLPPSARGPIRTGRTTAPPCAHRERRAGSSSSRSTPGPSAASAPRPRRPGRRWARARRRRIGGRPAASRNRCSTIRASQSAHCPPDGRRPGRASPAHSRAGSGTTAPVRPPQPRLDRALPACRKSSARSAALRRAGPRRASRAIRPTRSARAGQARILARLAHWPSFPAKAWPMPAPPGPRERRAQHGHVAGMIQHAVLLLVGGVVFLIDDDQPKVAERQEQRRARAHHHLRAPSATMRHSRRRSVMVTPECHSAGRAPNRASTRVRNSAVRAISGSSTSACRPAAQAFGHRFQIDLGLARPCHALSAASWPKSSAP